MAIIVNDNGLKAGTRFPDGLELIEHIPQGHKVALLDIPANGEIIRYGEVIGYAVRAIPRGSWIQRINGCTTGSAAVTHAATGNQSPGPLTAAGRIHL
ncbi:UxaA family hydrolase [Escherichia coli]